MRFVELGAEVASVPAEDRARDRLDQRTLDFANQIPAQEIRTAGSVFPCPPEAVIEESRKLCVDLVQIAGWILVQDDDVGAQPFQAPVLLRLKDLTHERHVVVAGDAHEQNGQIPGNAIWPQAGLTELVRRNRVRPRPQRAIGEEHPRRETFEQQRLVV